MNAMSGWSLLARSLFSDQGRTSLSMSPELKSGLRRWRIRREIENPLSGKTGKSNKKTTLA